MTSSSTKRVVQEFRFHVGGEPDRVFPLLCPVREYDWIDGWNCQLVHSESGVVEENCVFVTDQPPEGRTIWVTALHDPAAHRVGFVRVSPQTHVTRMDLTVNPADAGSSVSVKFTFTALNEGGGELLRLLATSGALAERVGRLGRSLDHFVRNGSMLKPFGGAA